MYKYLKHPLLVLALLSAAAASCTPPSSNNDNPPEKTIEAAAPADADPFKEAVNNATAAAEATQTATTPEEWDDVAIFWTNAIESMEAVPESNENYSIAQQKVGEYQPNLNYALSHSSSKEEKATRLNTAGTSKAYQCARLANVVSEAEEVMSEFGKGFRDSSATVAQNIDDIKLEHIKLAAQQQVTAASKAVDDIDKVVLELKGIQVSDTQILTYRDRHIEMLEGFGSALRQAGEAANIVTTVEVEADLISSIEAYSSQALTVTEIVSALSEQDRALTEEVNAYCSSTD